MPPQPLWHGFADESGDPDPYSGAPLALVALVTGEPRILALPVQRFYKRTGIRLHGRELKATFLEERRIEYLLARIAVEGLSIVCITVEKGRIVRPPPKRELIYHTAAARLLRRCAECWPRLHMHFDKRYTGKREQIEFEIHLREAIADLPERVVTISQDDSLTLKSLQAADLVAWAAGKRAGGDDRFWKLVQARVVADEVILKEKW